MFPTVRISFSGLQLDQRYAVLLDIVPVDAKRYRYAYHRSSWLVAGKADPPAPSRLYVHPDSPFTGDQLRKQVVSFEKVKLTNNEMDKHGQVSSEKLTFKYLAEITPKMWSIAAREIRADASEERTHSSNLIHNDYNPFICFPSNCWSILISLQGFTENWDQHSYINSDRGRGSYQNVTENTKRAYLKVSQLTK